MFRQTAENTSGRLLQCDLFVKPGGFVSVEHLHPRQEERFEIVQGRVHVRVNREERIAECGDVVAFRPVFPISGGMPVMKNCTCWWK